MSLLLRCGRGDLQCVHHRTDADPVRLRVPSRDGLVHVTPGSAGWTYVGFEVVRVAGRFERSEAGRETCVVLLAGICDLAAGDIAARGLGRSDVFAGPPSALS